MNNIKIEYLPIKDLKPYERNAKKHDETQIKNVMESIKQFGFAQPLVVDKDNVLIIGHCRLIAAKRLKLKEVPVVRMDELTQEQVDKLRLLDNKLNESEWDFDLLAEDVPTLDFSDFDIDWGLPEDIEENTEIEEDEAPEPPTEPKAKLGDLYILGNHRLICGDSTDITVIDRLMDGVKADMVFTDPPYGNGTSGKYGRGQLGVRTIAGDEDLSVFNDFVSIMNIDKIVYFLQWRTLAESLETIRNKGLKVNTVGVWDKKNAGLNGAGGISEQWEAIIFAGNIKYKKFGGNVFSIAREQHKREDSPHPHQKPIKLLAEIFDFIDECKIVLDPFGGSGSTLIACEQLNRKCYMAELDPRYVSVIVNRWLNFTGRKDEIFCIRDGQKLTYDEVFGE